MSIIIKSASYEPSDEIRDANVRRTVEGAGYELPEEALPPLPALDQTTGAPTPAEQEKNVKDYAAQVEAAKAKYDNWDQVVNREINIGVTTQLACLEAENGAEVIYWLATHEREAERIGKMSPVRQAAEVGRLSAQLPKPVRVARPPRTENATASEIAQMHDFPGKYRALKAAWRERR